MHPRSVSEQFATAQPRSSAGRDSVSGLSRPVALSSSGGSDHNHNHSSRNKTVTSIPPNLLPSAPASPPTPAPSPTPHQRPLNWQSSAADDEDDAFLVNARMHFSSLPNAKKQKFLMGILGLCDSKQLSFVSSFVSPRLRKDPFMVFPNELCLRVRLFIVVGCSGALTRLFFLGLGTLFHRRSSDPRKSIPSIETLAGTVE